MGLFGHVIGGPLGDLIEDKIRGDNKKKRRARENRVGKIPFTIPDGPVRLSSRTSERGRGLRETIFAESVRPKVGSVVCCRLARVVDHSGIYVGRNRIIHRDGDGFLASVSPEEFVSRLDGLNPSFHIYVACRENAEPIGDPSIARRAREALRDSQLKHGYNLLTKNCHQFTQYCVTGDLDNGIADFTFTNLENVLEREIEFDCWRNWEYD